jgi:uncharacterized membrane protein
VFFGALVRMTLQYKYKKICGIFNFLLQGIKQRNEEIRQEQKKKENNLNRPTNNPYEKKVPQVSYLSKSLIPSGADRWIASAESEEAPNLAKRSAHWLPNRRV